MCKFTFEATNTTKAEFANFVDPDETDPNEPSHLDLQCLLWVFEFFNLKQFEQEVFGNFADAIMASAFLAL